MINWSRYLESLCTTYAQWWQIYTITDVVGQKPIEAEPSPFLFDFGLMVQTVERGRGERGKREDKVERLSVLDGLRKYASEHVLLVGRPGSGKSTALARLLLEEAGKARTPLNSPLVRGEEDSNSLTPPLLREAGRVKIPVLVELRYYRTSILDLIQDFLQRHDPNLTVDAETLKSGLRQGQLLLLVDGLNELPSEEARRDLQKFRQDYQKTTPMIFTTRDLGVGGDLDIAKKLEMQPLSEAQMQQFVRAYLPGQGEQMLRQLGSRLREFGQTPLLLWMLCSLFSAMGKVPPNLGLVFRRFALSYDCQLKQDIPISGEFRRWCPRLLEQLAWVMTSGEAKAQLQVAIPRQKAQAVLTEFLASKVAHPEDCTLRWLEDLLKHHLIQLGAGDRIEFRHQLIQEYYTAESLLKQLPYLSDDSLKREYLNYLKWTEPLALMLELVDEEAQAVRVVRLALSVDLSLGARLAGAVKPEFKAQTVSLVGRQDIPHPLKLYLFGITRSDSTISHLLEALEDENIVTRRIAAYALDKIGSEAAIPGLLKALGDENIVVRRIAAYALGQIGSEAAISGLLKALEDESYDVRWRAAHTLCEIGSESAISGLLKALKHEKINIRWKAAEALGEIGSEAAIYGLLKALEDESYDVRWRTAYALGQIGSESAISGLLKALEDEDSNVRWRAAEALGQIGSELAIPGLLKALEDKDCNVCGRAAEALGQIGSERAFFGLLQILEDGDYDVHNRAIEALGKISSEATISGLLKALEDKGFDIQWTDSDALDKSDSDVAVSVLLKALEDEDYRVRQIAAYALGQIGTGAAFSGLLKAVEDEDYHVRWIAAYALGQIGTDAAIFGLLKALEDEDYGSLVVRVISVANNTPEATWL